jgi:hypothetical protein
MPESGLPPAREAKQVGAPLERLRGPSKRFEAANRVIP